MDYKWKWNGYIAGVFPATARASHWAVHGHMTTNETNAKSGQHCENYDAKRETVHWMAKCWPLLHVIRACSWRWPDAVTGILARFFTCFDPFDQEKMNDIIFSWNHLYLSVSLDFVSINIEITGKHNSLLPWCFISIITQTVVAQPKMKVSVQSCVSPSPCRSVF